VSRKLSAPLLTKTLVVGARSSLLSRKQVEEVFNELEPFYPEIEYVEKWVETKGDRDQKTSLRALEKTDFFTEELDLMILEREIDIAVHSAKDLPDPLPRGLEMIALTKGVDSRDSLVMPQGMEVETLPKGARIGTSSVRREKNLLSLRSDFVPVDIRGAIAQRISLLEQGKVDAVIIAEAALVRLGWTHLNRVFIEGEIAPLQGKLAIIAHSSREDLRALFKSLDSRNCA
jgi:hydroxymethylbilane synthase